MNKRFYILVIQGGTEPSLEGPYDSAKQRDRAARKTWKTLTHGEDNLFKANVDEHGNLSVYPFLGLGEQPIRR